MSDPAQREDPRLNVEEGVTEEVMWMAGPGLDQTSARRVARAIGGVATGARRGTKRWATGGWAPHDLWIVVTLDHRWVLHDGVDRRSKQMQEARPVPADAIVQ